VFPTFITTRMPIGLVGLMIAAIFAAAMSASGGELNALATATIIDFYRRHFVKDAPTRTTCGVEAGDVVWGCSPASSRCRGEPGLAHRGRQPLRSFFYGSLLGVFILAILTKRATARGRSGDTDRGMAVGAAVRYQLPWIAFLWHNLIGAVVVVVVGMAISYTRVSATTPALSRPNRFGN
jgi:Na+/proline symporter